MNTQNKSRQLFSGLILMLTVNVTLANQVEILAADFHNNSSNNWSVSITLKHEDKGWDHFADNWRVVTEKGDVLGDRVLYHPHVSEQPFTRSLAGVVVPNGVSIVYIEAHDKVHGWSKKIMKVDLSKAVNGRLKLVNK